MINMQTYNDLIEENIKIICSDGQIISGVWIDSTSEADNEPDGESITIEKPTGELVEIFVSDIKSIVKI